MIVTGSSTTMSLPFSSLVVEVVSALISIFNPLIEKEFVLLVNSAPLRVIFESRPAILTAPVELPASISARTVFAARISFCT